MVTLTEVYTSLRVVVFAISLIASYYFFFGYLVAFIPECDLSYLVVSQVWHTVL